MITLYSFIHRLKSWEQYRKQIAEIVPCENTAEEVSLDLILT